MRKFKSWSQAEAICNEIDTGVYRLVTIEDKEENDFLIRYIEENSSDAYFNFWIGLKEDGKKGQYIWADTSNLGYGESVGEGPWVSGESKKVLS